MPATAFPPWITTFPALIRWIADEYHDGAVWRIAPQIGVSVPLVNQWVHGIIRSPRTTNLLALSERYGLDFTDVLRTLKARPISGGSTGAGARAVALVAAGVSLIRRWLTPGPRLALA